MKRLIDAYALQEWMLKNAKPDMKQPGGVIDLILSGIGAQETVICVSDDFGPCPEKFSCRDVLCGGGCCEEPGAID